VAGVAVADADALSELITRFERRVYGAALAIVRDRALAEEVAQDTYVRAWRHAETYDPRRGSVAAWLLRITHNLAIDALRVRRPEPIDPLSLLREEHAAGDPLIELEHRDALRRLIAPLPTDQARALLLAAIHGQTALEISVHESIPLGTAKTRIRAAMRKLRETVDPDAAHSDPRNTEPRDSEPRDSEPRDSEQIVELP
jgi:RNA polymerase sigma factor (sigma-70 family)